MKRFKFYIQYWDRFGNTKHIILKARDADKAEKNFYKLEPYALIKKIALV